MKAVQTSKIERGSDSYMRLIGRCSDSKLFYDEVFSKPEACLNEDESIELSEGFSDGTVAKYEADNGETKYIDGRIVPSSYGIPLVKLLDPSSGARDLLNNQI